MRELSLFTGGGGGCLGTKLLGFNHIGYVEFNEYCQKIIAQRIKDGILDEAPIFGDIRAFVSDGYAASYAGLVDLITAGFPCQPFSRAGKGLGESDARNMWPATVEVVRIAKPKICFFENVPGLFTNPYFGTILDDLEEAGYTVPPPKIISAYEVGAEIMRERLWFIAYRSGLRKHELQIQKGIVTEYKIRNGPKNAGILDAEASQLVADGFGVRDAPPLAEVVEPIRAIGNGQVPLCMAYAYATLSQGITEP